MNVPMWFEALQFAALQFAAARVWLTRILRLAVLAVALFATIATAAIAAEPGVVQATNRTRLVGQADIRILRTSSGENTDDSMVDTSSDGASDSSNDDDPADPRMDPRADPRTLPRSNPNTESLRRNAPIDPRGAPLPLPPGTQPGPAPGRELVPPTPQPDTLPPLPPAPRNLRSGAPQPQYPPAQNRYQQPGPDNTQPMPPQSSLPQSPSSQRAGPSDELDGSWKPITSVTFASALPPGDVPPNLAAPRFARAGEVVAAPSTECDDLAYTFYWQTSAFACGPLYFEEPNLERYGLSHGCLQPVISGVHFFATVPLLPYKMVVHPPCKCVYSLGYYRPGDCVPRQSTCDPFQLDAAMVEAGVIAGLLMLP